MCAFTTNCLTHKTTLAITQASDVSQQADRSQKTMTCKSSLLYLFSTHCAADKTKSQAPYSCWVSHSSKRFAIYCSQERLMQHRRRYPTYYMIWTFGTFRMLSVQAKASGSTTWLVQSSIMWLFCNSAFIATHQKLTATSKVSPERRRLLEDICPQRHTYDCFSFQIWHLKKNNPGPLRSGLKKHITSMSLPLSLLIN